MGARPLEEALQRGGVMSIRVYIPTRGRVGLNRQVTLREFVRCSQHEPILVCPPGEARAHKRYWPMVMSCPADGIGPTRQWVLENSSADVVVMASDDLRFFYRPDPGKIKLEKCQDLDPLVDLMGRCVKDGYVHGGVGARNQNHNKDLDGQRVRGLLDRGHCFVDCERVNDLHYVDREAVLSLGARFDRLPVMEDFYFTLTLLCRGVPNRVIHDYVWNQEGSGWDGGCSIYRTAEVQAEGARGLAAAFPQWVRLVTKKSKDTSPHWRGIKERLDVSVYCWRAYVHARRTRPEDRPPLTPCQKRCGLEVESCKEVLS